MTAAGSAEPARLAGGSGVRTPADSAEERQPVQGTESVPQQAQWEWRGWHGEQCQHPSQLSKGCTVGMGRESRASVFDGLKQREQSSQRLSVSAVAAQLALGVETVS